MRAFLMKRDIVLVGLNRIPLIARGIRSGIIAALNIRADRTAVLSPSPRMLRVVSWGRVEANIAGTIAKYFATSFAMLKVVTAPRVMSSCFPSMTTSMIFAGFDSRSTPVVVFTHVPLWAVYAKWGWATDDSEQALGYLKRFGSVTVLNGHIHQVLQKVEGNVAFHTAMSTAFPQPAPGSAPSPGPLKVGD